MGYDEIGKTSPNLTKSMSTPFLKDFKMSRREESLKYFVTNYLFIPSKHKFGTSNWKEGSSHSQNTWEYFSSSFHHLPRKLIANVPACLNAEIQQLSYSPCDYR